MDNLLAQVTGTKRVVLYSPQDALHLYLSGQLMYDKQTWVSLNHICDVQEELAAMNYNVWFKLHLPHQVINLKCWTSTARTWSSFLSLWRQSDTSVCWSPEIYSLSQVHVFSGSTASKCNSFKRCIMVHPPPCFPPALWFHNTLALQFGVGVNVFWRHLPADSYDKKDPYGNKDPVAASRALQALERALNTLDELPADYRDFYGRCMIQRLRKRTLITDTGTQVSDSVLTQQSTH